MTSARVFGLRSRPMAPGYLLTPQPTSKTDRVWSVRTAAVCGVDASAPSIELTAPEYRLRDRIWEPSFERVKA